MADIEEQIHRAIEAGKFADLPGQGKPLKLDDHACEDPEWRLAYHVLRESGFSLPWIELQREIDAEIDALRSSLRQAWEWRSEALQRGDALHLVEQEWGRAVDRLDKQVQKLNRRIGDYNLQVPLVAVQRLTLNMERELERVKSRDSQ